NPQASPLWEAGESRLASQSSFRGCPPHPYSLMTRMETIWSTSPCFLIPRGLSRDRCHGANGKGFLRIGVIESIRSEYCCGLGTLRLNLFRRSRWPSAARSCAICNLTHSLFLYSNRG